MNLTNTNVDGWPASKMYTYLNTTIYNKLPSDLKSVIIDTITVSGYEKNKNANYTSTDKLYLLSVKEVGFDQSSDKAKAETRTLDYFVTYNTNEDRIKYEYGTTTKKQWWLRTATFDNTYHFFAVTNSGGIVYSNSNYNFIVSSAFRIGVN